MDRIDEIAARNPFKVPEGYFENLNSRIISSTVEKGNVTPVHRFISGLRPVMSAAAAIAMLALIGYLTAKVFLSETESGLMPEVSLSELSGYFLDEIDVATLEENIDPMLISGEFPVTEKEEIIDYLILENIDINEIYETY